MIPDVNMGHSVPPETKPKGLASQVQGMFTEVMLKAMEDSVDAEDGLFGNSASSDIYRGMLREHLATAMTKKMESPLEGVLDHALTKPSLKAISAEENVSDSHELPVDG